MPRSRFNSRFRREKARSEGEARRKESSGLRWALRGTGALEVPRSRLASRFRRGKSERQNGVCPQEWAFLRRRQSRNSGLASTPDSTTRKSKGVLIEILDLQSCSIPRGTQAIEVLRFRLDLNFPIVGDCSTQRAARRHSVSDNTSLSIREKKKGFCIRCCI